MFSKASETKSIEAFKANVSLNWKIICKRSKQIHFYIKTVTSLVSKATSVPLKYFLNNL